VRNYLSDDTVAGLVIMDNFKGQVTATISNNHLHVCLLPPNTTDLLQPMDLSVNKPAKSFLKNEFSEWYADEILQQLRAHRHASLNQIELDPIDLGLPALKELGARWLVKMVEYIEDNPQFVVNGFVKAGISKALDNHSADLSSEGSSTSSDESSMSSDERIRRNRVIQKTPQEVLLNIVVNWKREVNAAQKMNSLYCQTNIQHVYLCYSYHTCYSYQYIFVLIIY